MQLSRPPNCSSTVYVKLQEYRRAKKGKKSKQVAGRAFAVYQVRAKKLREFLMQAVETHSNGGGQ